MGDLSEIDKTFKSLPVERQVDTLLQSRGKERLRYLFFSENPKNLVERLPEIEIFLTVKEVGRSDAIDLVSLTTQEQFQYLIDLDFWKEDQIDREKAVRWMEILLECGEEKVAEFIKSSEPDFLALILMKFIHVRKIEEDPAEVLDHHLFFTLDREYFITFNRPGDRVVFRPLLEALYHVDSKRYRLLMESITRELESNLEEAAYRFRNARMADYGFPEFEQAMEIYQFIDPGRLQLQENRCRPIVDEEREKAAPTFYLTSRGEGPFFSLMLSKMTNPAELSRLKEELAVLCNKAMVAEPIDIFEVGEMERVLKKVFHYLDLGLQWLSRGDEGTALEILSALALQKIFQAAVGITVLLRKRAEALLRTPWLGGDLRKLSLLDPIHHEKLEGLLKRRPGVLRNGLLEDFRNVPEVKEANLFLDQMEAVLNALERTYNLNPERLQRLDLAGCIPEDWHDLTLSMIFLTSLANRVLTGCFLVEAVEQSRLKDLFPLIFEREEQGKGATVKREIRHDLEESLRSTEEDKEKRERVLAFWDFCLDLLKTEFGHLPPGEDIDPRFVKGLIIRK